MRCLLVKKWQVHWLHDANNKYIVLSRRTCTAHVNSCNSQLN